MAIFQVRLCLNGRIENIAVDADEFQHTRSFIKGGEKIGEILDGQVVAWWKDLPFSIGDVINKNTGEQEQNGE